MFELIFLGTSASAPSVRRGLSAQVIKHDEHRFLLDCGEGTQRQILRSGIGFRGLSRILITHGHLDHILGLAGLFSTFTRWETMEQVEIFAGGWALERIHALLYDVRVIPKKFTAVEVKFTEVQPGTIIQEEDFSIEAFPVTHRGPDCYGYLFEERARRPFLVEKAEALSVPAGPARRDLVNGKSITLEDGREVKPDEVLGEETPGTKLVHTGDTGRTDNILEYARHADALVTEATYIEEEAEMAKDFHHLTAQQAADLAKKAEVNKLILTHISRRYRERDVRDEARAVFPNSIVARDFDVFQVKRGEVKKVVES
ncbi:MAG: ribonuclease Z [Chloroflexi bacterium]|nr:MAG: ribonuclease Z [Chloroflexota bacterium]MBL1193288.1 ribonuclease Z [Chloroflexota bacterium]NOH10580.1 ribonuclease Z [Chloroflexota bacterium]